MFPREISGESVDEVKYNNVDLASCGMAPVSCACARTQLRKHMTSSCKVLLYTCAWVVDCWFCRQVQLVVGLCVCACIGILQK